jgi:hypothetical protein
MTTVSSRAQKRMLVLGVAQVLLGCLIGFIPPTAVEHFRSLVTSHIEFTANGVMLGVLGLMYPYIRLGSGLLLVMELLAYVGTFSNGGAFVISAFTGSGTPLAVTVHKLFPFPQGLDGPWSHVVTNCLMICGVTTVGALLLALIGLLRSEVTIANETKKKN